MELLEIKIPAGLSGDFFCPLSGEPAVSEDGFLAASCIGYIPPLAFHDAIISCPHFEDYWERILEREDITKLREDLAGESIKKYLLAYEAPAHQKLIGFRVETTSLVRLYAPEFSEPVYTVPFFYIINFWCDLSEQQEGGCSA
jgi:hypothetical protein